MAILRSAAGALLMGLIIWRVHEAMLDWMNTSTGGFTCVIVGIVTGITVYGIFSLVTGSPELRDTMAALTKGK